MIALGIIIPVLPKLVEGFLGGDTARAAEIYGLFGTGWAAMQFLWSPMLGGLSDRFGRRPVILLSNFGLGIDYVVMALAPNLGWLFAGRLFSGITGASFTTAWAYIADITTPEGRAAGFGRVGAAWGLGFILGPALGGFLGSVDPRLPFWVAAALTLLNATYGLFILPESLPVERRKPFRWSRANPVGSLVLLRSHPELLGLASVYLIYFVSHQVMPSVFVLYTGHRYGWDARSVGFTLAAVGVLGAVVQGGLVRVIVRRFGERRSLLAALLCGTMGYACFGLAPSAAVFWSGLPVFAFMGLFGPSVQGLMSRRVAPSEQGELQGANSSIMGIAGMIGPSLFALTFARFLRPVGGESLPGAAFLLAGLMTACGWVLAWRVTRPR